MAKKFKISTLTPRGFLYYPKLAEPNSQGEYHIGVWLTDFLMLEEAYEGSKLQAAIEEVASKEFPDKKDKIRKPVSYLKDEEGIPESLRKYVKLFANNKNNQPMIVDSQKNEMSKTAIAELNSGDECILFVSIFPYNQNGGGLSAGLDIVQFIKKGKPFEGMGNAKKLAQMPTIEVEEVTAETVEDLLK